jgi:hypothetical protein
VIARESCGSVKLGGRYRITETCETSCKVDGCEFWVASTAFTPVIWEVGLSYETTLPGVFATITEIGEQYYYGTTNDSAAVRQAWHLETGIYAGFSLSQTHVPHLTPSRASEATKDCDSDATPRWVSTARYEDYVDYVEAWKNGESKSEEIRRDAAAALEKVDAKKAERNDEPSYTDSQRYSYIVTDSSWGGRPPMSALRDQEGDCVQHRYSDDATSPKKHSPRITESEILTRNRELQACADAIIAKGLELSDVKMAAYTDGLEDAMRFTKLRDSLDASPVRAPEKRLQLIDSLDRILAWRQLCDAMDRAFRTLQGLRVASDIFMALQRHDRDAFFISTFVRSCNLRDYVAFGYLHQSPDKDGMWHAEEAFYDAASLAALSDSDDPRYIETAADIIRRELHEQALASWVPVDREGNAEDYRYRPSAEEDRP